MQPIAPAEGRDAFDVHRITVGRCVGNPREARGRCIGPLRKSLRRPQMEYGSGQTAAGPGASRSQAATSPSGSSSCQIQLIHCKSAAASQARIRSEPWIERLEFADRQFPVVGSQRNDEGCSRRR